MYGFGRVQVDYGFKEEPEIPRAMTLCMDKGPVADPAAIWYFLSRETVILTKGTCMAPWRETLFATMSRNAGSVVDFLKWPGNGVVELGTRVQI